jgi:4-diphosphocytidyl-2-C-methyl-D-erythritol kinase
LLSRTARGEGRGDRLTLLEDAGLSGRPILLVNPGGALSTPAVFTAWDGVDRGALEDWETGRNDLQPSALGLAGEIAEVLDALSPAPIARMSGSGATCFGIFEDEESCIRTRDAIVRQHPHRWAEATRLR